MFENLVSNIKRRLTKTSENISDDKQINEKTGIKRSWHLLRSKMLMKAESKQPTKECDYTALSPRAVGVAECAETEIEWPLITDNNPNILDKFTRIVSISYDTPSYNEVCN